MNKRSDVTVDILFTLDMSSSSVNSEKVDYDTYIINSNYEKINSSITANENEMAVVRPSSIENGDQGELTVLFSSCSLRVKDALIHQHERECRHVITVHMQGKNERERRNSSCSILETRRNTTPFLPH
jgi:hypothetical protein